MTIKVHNSTDPFKCTVSNERPIQIIYQGKSGNGNVEILWSKKEKTPTLEFSLKRRQTTFPSGLLAPLSPRQLDDDIDRLGSKYN